MELDYLAQVSYEKLLSEMTERSFDDDNFVPPVKEDEEDE